MFNGLDLLLVLVSLALVVYLSWPLPDSEDDDL